MAATIRDVKEMTGLSLATISKYLNGGNVLPENKALIDAAVKELHYEVNEIARGLVTQQTKTVGVLVYDISSFFSSNILHYIGQELRKNGYGMMICDSCNDVEVEKENLRFLLSRRVDGIIVLPVNHSGVFLRPAKEANIPVVLLDRELQDETFDCVCIDNRIAAFRAVDVLIQHRHKRIAIIGSDSENTGIERYRGYRDAMEQAGLPVKEEYVLLSRFDVREGYEKMKQLLQMDEPPTAVFLSNYETALGAVTALNESSILCPEQISLFGFDDLLVSKVVRPKLWLVVQPMEVLCANAVRLLLERIKGEEERDVMKLTFGARLQEGDSIRKLEE